MKVRQGFVTNSSSTSFILAYNELPTIPNELLEEYPELCAYNQMIQEALEEEDYPRYDDKDVCHIITEKDELDDFFIEEYGNSTWGYQRSCLSDILKNKEYLQKQYQKALDCINHGQKVLYRKLPYGSTKLKIIRGLIQSGKIIAITDISD